MEIVNKKSLLFECKRCGTEFRFGPEDYKHELIFADFHYIKCPCCKKRYDLGRYNFDDLVKLVEFIND